MGELQTTKRPNILLIMIESWDGRVIGALGDPALKNVTPNIDQLAREGVMFKNTYTSHPICCPARANMWSGQYTFHIKSWNNHKGLERGTPILRDVLEQKGGYISASKKGGIGKHDYLSGGHTNQNRITAWTGAANIELPSYTQKPPKIDRWGKKVHKIDWVFLNQAKKFLKQQAKAQKSHKGNSHPFFLYLSLITPHPRFHTSQHWLKQVDYDAVSIPPKDEKLHPVIRFQQIQKAWMHGLDPESKRRTRAIYYGMIAEMDAMIGEVMKNLDELGLRENTYVILVADHGENNMEHDLYYKMNMYESSVRIPLIMRGPDLQKGVVMDQFASLIDLYPTILDMAGLSRNDAPNPLDGLSLLPLARGSSTEFRDYAFSMFTGTAANTSMFMLRTGDYKYIAYPGYSPQLFNLKDDPNEVHDLSDEHPELISELDQKLKNVVDYPAVHKEWQAYCRQSFREYKARVEKHPVPLFEYGGHNPKAYYKDIMANTYKGWTPEHEAQLDRWLNGESVDNELKS
jgi:arylsulfatase K